MKSCIKIDQNTLIDLFSCEKGIRHGDGLSPVLFSLFMNDLLQYFKQNKCPSLVFKRTDRLLRLSRGGFGGVHF